MVHSRVLFSTQAASSTNKVMVRSEFPLPWGGDAFLAVEVALGKSGNVVPAQWIYYEKTSATDVVFDAKQVDGTVLVLDRFETLTETSLQLSISATFVDGDQQRVLKKATFVTAPSPQILRTEGQLPAGMVVADNGTATYVVGPAYHYDRGLMNCTGVADETPVVYDNDYSNGSEIVYDEEIVVYEDETIVYDDYPLEPEEDTGCGASEEYEEYEEYDEYETTDDTDDSYDGSSDDFDCVGDAEASSKSGSKKSGPVLVNSTHRIARRVVRMSPMLLLIVLLLVARERFS